MSGPRQTRRIDTLVIGGGQAGLSVGYHLAKRGQSFLILDGSARIGDAWRSRWDSLRVFTPARFSGLDGMPFPGPPTSFPTKDQMADYMEEYANRFGLPIECGARVQRLARENGRFVALTDAKRFEADQVVVAMSDDQRPRVPEFAGRLDPRIRAFHSAHYRNPGQLQEGPVLLVGAGNSGADIALDLTGRHHVWLAGRDVGHVPFRLEWRLSQALLVPLVLRVVFHRVLTVRTPLGRKIRPEKLALGDGLVRVKPKDLARAGVERVPRVRGVKDGLPELEDGRVLEPANVIWCTGFSGGFDWIDLPIHGGVQPLHESGVVTTQPGLYFVGLRFLHAVSSSMIHGVGRDAERIAGLVAARAAQKSATRGGTRAAAAPAA